MSITTYKGFVEAIRKDIAHLVIDVGDQSLNLQWDAADLNKRGIGERQPFIFQEIVDGENVEYDFVLDQLKPISEKIQSQIEVLRTHYLQESE